MRAPLCVVAAWLALAACTPAEPTGGPQPDSGAARADAGPRAVDEGSDAPSDDAQDGPEANPLVALLEQDIPYGEGPDGNFVGFLAVPEDAAEPLPGVIVIHEWFGLNENIREIARRIARDDYVVLAIDLYGGRTAATVTEAQKLLRELVEKPPEAVRSNIRQGYEYLERYALAPRIGVIGWDLGGRWALQTALMLPDRLDAMVMFYGAVETDERLLDSLDMPILGLFAAEDGSIPVHEVQEFRATLGRLRKAAEVRIYSDVEHGFFFPGSRNYDPITADDAWIRSQNLLRSSLK